MIQINRSVLPQSVSWIFFICIKCGYCRAARDFSCPDLRNLLPLFPCARLGRAGCLPDEFNAFGVSLCVRELTTSEDVFFGDF